MNEIFLMSGCEVIHEPSSLPPLTTLSTPAGSAACNTSPSCRVESGVNGEGLSTMVLPASSAGAILDIAIITGKFHGVIPATTPYGR